MSMCKANVSPFKPEPGPVLVLLKDVAERIQVTHNCSYSAGVILPPGWPCDGPLLRLVSFEILLNDLFLAAGTHRPRNDLSG